MKYLKNVPLACWRRLCSVLLTSGCVGHAQYKIMNASCWCWPFKLIIRASIIRNPLIPRFSLWNVFSQVKGAHMFCLDGDSLIRTISLDKQGRMLRYINLPVHIGRARRVFSCKTQIYIDYTKPTCRLLWNIYHILFVNRCLRHLYIKHDVYPHFCSKLRRMSYICKMF